LLQKLTGNAFFVFIITIVLIDIGNKRDFFNDERDA